MDAPTSLPVTPLAPPPPKEGPRRTQAHPSTARGLVNNTARWPVVVLLPQMPGSWGMGRGWESAPGGPEGSGLREV